MTAYFIYLIIGQLLVLWVLADQDTNYNTYRDQVLARRGAAATLGAILFMWPLIIVVTIIRLMREK